MTVADGCSEKMYGFFMSVKQKDGSFMVARHSEVDVRYVYQILISFASQVYHVVAEYIVYSWYQPCLTSSRPNW